MILSSAVEPGTQTKAGVPQRRRSRATRRRDDRGGAPSPSVAFWNPSSWTFADASGALTS